MNPAFRRDDRFPAGRRVQGRLQRQLRPLALAAASLFALSPAGAAGPALPGGLNVVQGQASTALNGNRLTVTNSAGALLDWQQFNIGAGAAVHFAQPSAASKVLNRVVGNDPSTILGSLSSNGQVWLQNPNGVLFGQGARIDVASLVATTLAIDTGAWQDGLRTGSFRLGDAAVAGLGGIVNQGELRSASGGQVLLVAGAGGVQNMGLIHAPDGQVLLAAGAQVDLVDSSLPRLGLRLQAPQGEVLNLGQVLVGSGRVDLQAAMVNQQGIVRADSIGAGGVVLASASEALNLGAGSVTSASGATGGQVALDAGSGTLLAAGRIDATASAGSGGQVSLLGRQVGLVDGGAIDASGFAGGGAVRLGGGLRGQEAAYRNAEATFLGRGASIHADATGRGDGGLVVLWGSQAMRAYGTLSARGGALGGDGGFIETSGGWIDARPLAISTQAPAGRAGQWLLDPDDITISDGSQDGNISSGPVFSSTGSPSSLWTGTLAAALNAGNDVSVTTSANSPNSSGNGDITVSAANLLVAPPNAVTLTLNAIGNIEFDTAVISSSGSPLTLRLNAGASGGQLSDSQTGVVGGGIHLVSTSITTAGGNIELGGPTLACGPTLGCSTTGSAAVGVQSRLTEAISLDSSSLNAGTGSVVMRGDSLIGFTTTTAVQLTDSTVRGRTIDIRGTVDANFDNTRTGVAISGGQLTATDALTVTGLVSTQALATSESTMTGVQLSGGAILSTEGNASTLAVDGRVGSGTPTQFSFSRIYGIDIADDGTRLLAGPGGAIDLVGQVSGSTYAYGINIVGQASTVIDASAGSRLTLNSDSPVRLTGFVPVTSGSAVPGLVVAPSGGSLVVSGGEGVAIDAMVLSGTPATAQFSGSVVAIGTTGRDTSVRFTGNTALTVRADTVQLGANAVVSSAASGTAIDMAGLASGTSVQVFSNLGGTGALLAPSGRWLVHATDSADVNTSFQPGTLAASFWQYGDTPGTTVPAQAGNGFMFASTPVLSLAGSGALVKTYDGSTAADLSSANLNIAGLRSGQSLVGAPTFADANAGTAKPLALATGAGGNSVVTSDQIPVYGYTLDPTTARGTINQRPVTLLAATAADKVYNGDFAADITAWTLGNVVTGDDVVVASGSGQFTGSSPDVGVGLSVLAQVGTLGGTAASNYVANGASVTTTASITPRPLTLQSVTLADKVYDGSVAATVSSWSLGNVVGEDDVGLAAVTALFSAPAAGSARPAVALAGSLTGSSAANYSADGLTASTTGNILPRPLTLQSVAVADKVYDGGTAATVTAWQLAGVLEGDSVQVQSGSAAFASANAGTARPVTASVATLGGTAAANYSASGASATTTASITPRPLTLQSVAVADKVYDGSTAATVTAWQLAGVLEGDSVQVQSGSAAFASANAGTSRPVTASVATLGGTAAANYSASGASATTTASITARPLTLQSVAVADKVYDGGTAATVTAWQLAGVLEGDSVQVQSGSAAFASPDAGTSRPVTASVASLGGTAAANYSASGLSTQTLAAITPATLTYVADALTLRVGAALPTLTGTVTGFIGEDSLSTATSGTLRFDTELPSVPVPGQYWIAGRGLSASNYSFLQAEGNATALTLTTGVLPPEPVETSTLITSINATLKAVLPPIQASTPASGRALDAVPMLAPTAAAGGRVGIWGFDSLDLDQMSASSIAMALAARDAYKNEVFKAARAQLVANPAAADARGCASQQQAASGECLLLQPVASALDISNARVVERMQGAAPPPAQPPVAPAPAPAQPVAAAPAAPAAAPAAPAAPAVPLARVQPLPPDLTVNLPQRQAVARAAVPQIQRKIAVLIGIDGYRDERIPQLGNAVSDARAVARTLTERLGYETVVLENPGKATIFRTLNQLAGQVGPNDSVVLYYAGHGDRIEQTGLGYWQPADADASRAETWISNADIERLLRSLPATQLAMVSDSCFSGSLVSGERIRGVAATPDAAALLSKRAVVVMTSGGNEPVFDAGLNNHSPFAWNLMQSLNQVGAQAIGWRPGSNVFEQVRFAVARKLPQRPQYGASSGGGHEQGADYLFEQRQLR